MGFHTYDADRAAELDDPERFRHCSAEELLGALEPTPSATVADFGSGTGFYTDVVAAHAGSVYAVDVQPTMHERYRRKGVPENVTPVAAEVASLPFSEDALDGAFSTMTYHEFANEAALAEVARVLAPGGRLVTVDWTGAGDGDAGPPTDERFALGEAVDAAETAGFRTVRADTRTETFVHVAVCR
ncbi:MAG: class I SAM-dependent methyltransferase [Halolamina sp.]